jgi:1-acyl-sn-glycerol-3-phosphate acyltransferase
MLPFKKGGFVFAIETGATIVPIAITGTASILPRAAWVPRHGGDVRVSICRPISARTYPIERRDALLADVREAIAAQLAAIDGVAHPVPRAVPVSAPVGARSPSGR